LGSYLNRLQLLDYGRFFAAFVVVLFHLTFNGIVNGKIDSITHFPHLIDITKYGYLGVEFFFMISGYVIFFSAQSNNPGKFAVSRALRLYPAYWFAVIFTAIFATFWGGEQMSVYLTQVLVNLTMLQGFLGLQHVDGVYWTLVYELQFYVAVFAILFIGLGKHLRTIFLLWPVLLAVALLLELQNYPYLGGYFYYFSAGTILAMMKEKTTFREVIALFVIFLLAQDFSMGQAILKESKTGIHFSVEIVAAIVSACFLFFLLQNSQKISRIKLPYSERLGSLTYPLYLIHAHFGYMLLSRFANEDNKIAAYIVVISIILLLSYLLNSIIERKLHKVWKNLFNATLLPLVDNILNLTKSPLWLKQKSS